MSDNCYMFGSYAALLRMDAIIKVSHLFKVVWYDDVGYCALYGFFFRQKWSYCT